MPASISCSSPPRLTRSLTGALKLAIRYWKATSTPMLSVPPMTRSPPTMRMAAVVRPLSSVGTTVR